MKLTDLSQPNQFAGDRNARLIRDRVAYPDTNLSFYRQLGRTDLTVISDMFCNQAIKQ
jgi:hypothetical protein